MFNDPFDCVYNCDYEYEVTQIRAQILKGLAGKEEALRMLDSEFWGEKLKSVVADFESNMHRIHKKYERNKYIACFSEKENADIEYTPLCKISGIIKEEKKNA